MARQPFNPRRQVSEQLPQIRRLSGGSRAAESIGRSLEGTSAILGKFADRETKRLAAQRGAEDARQREQGAPDLQSNVTLAGRSYNAAAVDVFRSKLENRARADVNQITRESEHDPQELQQRLDSTLEGYLSEIPDSTPQLKQEFTSLFQRQRSAALDQAFRQKSKRLDSERAAAAADQIEGRMEGMERLALSSGVDEDARDQLIEEQRSLEDLLVEHGPQGSFTFDGQEFEADETRSGIYSPEDIQQMLQSAEDRVLTARVMGTFRNADDPSEFRDEFARDFTDPDTGEFRESPSTGLSRKQHERLLGQMDSALSSMATEADINMSALRSDVRDTTEMLEKGFSPGDGTLESLESRVRQAGQAGKDSAETLWEDLQGARDLFDFHNSIKTSTPAQLEGVIDRTRARINEQGNQTDPQTFARLEHAENLLGNMRQGLKRDPLGWANRVGRIALDDVQFVADEPEQAVSSMKRRRDQAQGVAQTYGIRAKYLTDTEAESLTSTLETADTDTKVALLSNIQQGFGNASRGVLGQISDNVPVSAHVGGLLALDNDMPVDAHVEVARRALEGQRALAEGNRVLPSDADLQLEIDNVVGASLSNLPQTRSSLISTAEALYTEHALRRGISSEQPNPDLWERSLEEAAGAIYDNGRKVGGGFVEFNGSRTIAPPELNESDLEETVDSMRTEDLISASVGGEPPRYGNGEVVPAADIADHGRLVPIDVGKYLVDMSDDGTGFLEGSGPDGHYVMDLRGSLSRLNRDRPKVELGPIERARTPEGFAR